MLSIENPPSDLHLKSDDDVNEKIKSSSFEIETVVVDLPRFSIRDYVFSARNKDIATNWPFSEKNLQLCQKHGVTNLLPPFQPIDSVRNQSVKICTVYDTLFDQENQSNLVEKTTRQSEQYESVSADGSRCSQKLKSDYICSSVSDQGEREVPSTVEQSHSERDSGAANLLESHSGAILLKTSKTDRTFQAPAKKSKLILKLGNLAGHSMKVDNMTSSFMVSETMASKVCPVCKTFSSSSNTTLNAHIDQCLSGESTTKLTADPKVIKHRIKPRKTRLMVDIYSTAVHCTLEDLDRRNGTNWAMTSTPPDQSNELCAEERVEKLSSAPIEETAQEGAVYIDTNGTKVRILSKFSNDPNVDRNPRPQSILRGDKGSKYLTGKKKKHHLHKQQNCLNLDSHDKACPPKPHSGFETHGGPNRNLPVEQSGEKEVQWGRCLKAQEQIKHDDSGIIRHWVGSTRTGLRKKTSLQDNHPLSPHNSKNFGERYKSSLSDLYVGSNRLLKTQKLSSNSVSSQCSKRMETSTHEHNMGLYREQQPLKRKREELLFLSSKGVGSGKRSATLPKGKKLRKEGMPVRDSCNNSPNHAATGASSLSYKAVDINAAPTRNSDSFCAISKSSHSRHEISSKSRKLASTRKKVLLTKQVVWPESTSDVTKKRSAQTKSQDSRLKIDFAERLSQNDDDLELDPLPDFVTENPKREEITVKMSPSRTRTLRIRNNRGLIKVSREVEAAGGSKSSASEAHYRGYGVGVANEFSPVNFSRAFEDSEESSGGEESESEDLPTGEHVATDSTLKVAIGESYKSSSNSIDPEFYELPRSPGKSKSSQCAAVSQQHICGPKCSICLDDPCTGDKQELFTEEEVHHVMIGEGTDMGAEIDSKDEQVTYFSEVDPILIPGPPGSFLPSPRHMGSDDFQGDSSLTSCRVQSIEHQHDRVDREKSDSPTSAISDISNPTLAMSKSKSSRKFFEPLAVQDETKRGFSGAAQVPQPENIGAEQPTLDALKIDATYPEKAPIDSKFEQLCCCSRKEGAPDVALNFQGSQLLRRRSMLTMPFPEKHMDIDCSERFVDLSSGSDMYPGSNHPCSAPETVLYTPRKLASEHIDEVKVYAGHVATVPNHRDHDSASPSAPNPVLRLMGKNLMVVNKDDDVSLQHRQHQSSSMNAQAHLQYITIPGVSPGIVGNKDYHSYHQGVTQGPEIFSQVRRQDAFGQQFDARKLSRYFEGDIDLKAPTTPFHAAGVNFPSTNAAITFTVPLGQNENESGRNMLTKEQRPKNRLDTPLAYGLEKPFATSTGRYWDLDSTSSREVIVIDDGSNKEDDSAIGAMCNKGMRRTLVNSSSNLHPGASEFSSRFVTPFYSNQLDGAGSRYGARPGLHHASFQMPVSEGINTSSLKRNCTPEGPSLLHPSAVDPPPSFSGHLRPTFYYTPSFS